MTPTPTQVREALRWFRPAPGSLKSYEHVAAAARVWLDLHTECETCGGKGKRLSVTLPGYPDCSACGGRGYTLDPVRLAEVATVISATSRFNDWATVAEQAILAYLGEPR